ncbi:UNVERIFIED_ORG: hypothetical protein QE446_001625 [Rhizobium sp. SORGH_AS260]|nr:hypothetical protein [Rhizobium sp. SORGH_AS_0285]MDP9753768.1 hypothetical protein [Rhizobium sp. SORGH_AS_0260]MDR6080743.1 hypothetical protein [Agrobacterium sp. SORGH_AS_0440]
MFSEALFLLFPGALNPIGLTVITPEEAYSLGGKNHETT